MRLLLRTFQSPGDILMLTAVVRDLHLAHPGKFVTDVRTSAPALWENNPYLTPLDDHDPHVEKLDMHYPLVHQSDRRPYHFLHGYVQYLEERLGVKIPVTRFAGDIHLSAAELNSPSPLAAYGHEGPFWIVIAGGKYDFTAKWWNPANYQAVVDHFRHSSRHRGTCAAGRCAVRPRLHFVQCGEAGHFHPPLEGVINLVGKTSPREFIMLMHHAAGVLCPVTFAMHLAAAVPVKEVASGKWAVASGNSEWGMRNSAIVPPSLCPSVSHSHLRPCVVVAGGREPAHWEQYPGHQFLHTIGALDCCANGGCWRSRCQPVGDGDAKDRQHVCEHPVQVAPELRIARCMAMIEPRDVIRAIEMYIGDREQHPEGTRGNSEGESRRVGEGATERRSDGATARDWQSKIQNPKSKILIDFRHGLGDAVQLTTVLLHLRHYHPDWQIDVAAGVGKLPRNSEFGIRNSEMLAPNSPFRIPNSPLYHRFLVRGRDAIDRASYKHVFELAWDECPTSYPDSPSTKAEYCLRSVFNLEPIRELCRYELPIGPEAMAAAKTYLESICGPGRKAEFGIRNGEIGTEFRIPNSELSRNGIPSHDQERKLHSTYPAVLLHYQANTSTEKKNLSHDLARKVCEVVLEAGYLPVILDWDKRSPLPDGVRIHNPHADAPLWGGMGTGDCEVLAALIAQSVLVIGVDSGPLHVAGIGNRGQGTGNSDKSEFGRRNAESTIPNSAFPIPNSQPPIPNPQSPTPTLAVWTGHHPLHYFCAADHVTHLVPEDHATRLRGDRAVGQAYFEKNYRYRTYRQLDDALPALVQELLSRDSDGLLRTHGFWVRGDNAEQDLVIVRDIAEQDSYRIAELAVPGPVAVDVGAHIGVFSRAFKQRHPSARVVAVECCPENIPALERNVGDFAAIVPAALTYERDVMLLNAVYPGCVSTGGSRVVPRSELEDGLPSPSSSERDGLGRPSSEYWLDGRPLPTVTLEQIMFEQNLDRIDVLKLDCEGSEFSILENTTSLDKIGAVIGEFHGRERFLEMVARKFSDWHLRILRDEDPGTFWLTRSPKSEVQSPKSEQATVASGQWLVASEEEGNPKSKIESPTSAFRIPNSRSDFWQRFLSVVHPIDQPVPEGWRQYYTALFELARELAPRRVCEIGVRAGYSAFAILSACPDAWMLGVDADLDEATHNTHTGRKGLHQHAEKILAGFNYHLLIADSHSLDRLPRCDLAYLDGDHTLAGCLADLRLAERSTDTILVDDYDSLPGVREACDQFAAERPDFTSRYIANGLTGFLLFERQKAEGRKSRTQDPRPKT